MDRYKMEDLKKWKNSTNRKPLIIRGARQVGKTWLMQEFGRKYYEKCAYINFDDNTRMNSLFNEDFNIEKIKEKIIIDNLPDYYEENFVNIIYDKLTEGMGLSKDERKSLLDLLLNQRHDPMYYDIICQEFKNHLFKEEVRTIFRLNGKYFEIRWIRKNESFDEPDEFPNDPIEVVKTTRVVKEWVAKSDQYNFDPVLLKEQKAKLQKYLKKIDCILDILEMEKMDY